MIRPPVFVLFAILSSCVALGGAVAEEKKPPAVTQAAAGIRREPMQKFEVPGTNFETHIIRVGFDPNFEVGRHTHPGPEGSYVLEGSLTYMIDGQEPVTLSAGQSIQIPPNTVHAAKMGPDGAVLLGTYVLEKGKPFMTKLDAAEPAK